jgi:hypothetical protein
LGLARLLHDAHFRPRFLFAVHTLRYNLWLDVEILQPSPSSNHLRSSGGAHHRGLGPSKTKVRLRFGTASSGNAIQLPPFTPSQAPETPATPTAGCPG